MIFVETDEKRGQHAKCQIEYFDRSCPMAWHKPQNFLLPEEVEGG